MTLRPSNINYCPLSGILECIIVPPKTRFRYQEPKPRSILEQYCTGTDTFFAKSVFYQNLLIQYFFSMCSYFLREYKLWKAWNWTKIYINNLKIFNICDGKKYLTISVSACYGKVQKYRPFWVSVLHLNSGLGRILECIACCCRFRVVCIGNRNFLVRQNYLFIDSTSRNWILD